MFFMRAIQGHSGRNKVDLALQDSLQFLHDWIEYIYRVGSSILCSFIILSGLIAAGLIWKEGWRTVFFTAVDPTNEPQRDEAYDVKVPRVVFCRTIGKCDSLIATSATEGHSQKVSGLNNAKKGVTHRFLTAIRKLTVDGPKISASILTLLPFEDHSYVATWHERARYEKIWAISSDGQGHSTARDSIACRLSGSNGKITRNAKGNI